MRQSLQSSVVDPDADSDPAFQVNLNPDRDTDSDPGF